MQLITNRHNNFFSNLFGLQSKTALITGCATGIGFAICDGLSKAGADIIGLSNSSDDSKIKELVRKNGRIFYPIKADFTKINSVEEIFTTIITRFPDIKTIDILINNAGINLKMSANEHSKLDWETINKINLTIPFFLSKSYYSYLTERKKTGTIINVLSIAGGYKSSGYACTKHALLSLTKSLAYEWGSHGIRVNAIAPGYINTKMAKDFILSKNGANFVNNVGLKRYGVPDDLIGVAIFLSSSASSYINGEVVTIDGGVFRSSRG